MKINKVACKLGIAVGIIMILAGIAMITMKIDIFENDAGIGYERGFTSFGADFYTYVNNNAAFAGASANKIGLAMEDAVGFLMKGFGALMTCFGAFNICLFWTLIGPKDAKADTESNPIKPAASLSKKEETPERQIAETDASKSNKARCAQTPNDSDGAHPQRPERPIDAASDGMTVRSGISDAHL